MPSFLSDLFYILILKHVYLHRQIPEQCTLLKHTFLRRCNRNANIIGIPYNHMIFAEIGCSSNADCIGILDEGCTGQGPFRLCKKGFISPSSSCIYKNRAYSGTCLYLSFTLFYEVLFLFLL